MIEGAVIMLWSRRVGRSDHNRWSRQTLLDIPETVLASYKSDRYSIDIKRAPYMNNMMFPMLCFISTQGHTYWSLIWIVAIQCMEFRSNPFWNHQGMTLNKVWWECLMGKCSQKAERWDCIWISLWRPTDIFTWIIPCKKTAHYYLKVLLCCLIHHDLNSMAVVETHHS